jgi:hypothetical protein
VPRLSITSGNDQSGIGGEILAEALVVTYRDADLKPIFGAEVLFLVTPTAGPRRRSPSAPRRARTACRPASAVDRASPSPPRRSPGDFDADGDPDLVSANPGANTLTLHAVLLDTTPAATTPPTFSSATRFFTEGFSFPSLTLADVNGDARVDLLIPLGVMLSTTAMGATTPS